MAWYQVKYTTTSKFQERPMNFDVKAYITAEIWADDAFNACAVAQSYMNSNMVIKVLKVQKLDGEPE